MKADTLNPIFQFHDAERIQLKASIMIEGLTGSGKSGLALLLGFYLANGDWSKVFHIDTENKSAELFAGIPFSSGSTVGKFKVGQLTEEIGYKPSNYLAYRKAAINAGAQVVIEDSISHAWQYQGGVLDMVNTVANRTNKGDKYGAWRDEQVSKEKNNLLSLLRDPNCHVITTVRVKEKFEYIEEDGKNKLKSQGEQQIQQADLKYEPDLVLHMLRPGQGLHNPPRARVVKSRYAILAVDEEYDFTPELCLQLKAYLEEGADPLEILERQREEYANITVQYLNANPNKKMIWDVIKEDNGFKDVKLKDIPLASLKQMYIRLTID